MFMFSSPLLLLLLGLSVVSALVGITKDVFSKNSALLHMARGGPDVPGRLTLDHCDDSR